MKYNIGNFVKPWKNEHNGVPSESIEWVCIDSNDLIEILYEGYKPQPIKLTEDWFKNFGFDSRKEEWDGLDFSYDRDLIEKEIFLGYREDKGYCIFYWCGSWGPSPFIWLNYVHEFQNKYFAITGEELKYKK